VTDAILQSLADRLQIQVVAGLIHVTPPFKYNEARLFSPHATVRSYYKHHLLPPHESKLTPGKEFTIVDKAAAPWGVAICKDMDFTPLARTYGRLGVGLMLVPAWDFNVDRLAHGHMAIMRGVESGFAIARSAKQGYITASDNRGRILAESRSDAAPFATLLVDVPVVHADTLYQRFGDWFAWFALVLFAFAVARATIATIQGRAADP
jgi:apolipoprotein N-acyltransferase